jgi:hypothetical protein
MIQKRLIHNSALMLALVGTARARKGRKRKDACGETSGARSIAEKVASYLLSIEQHIIAPYLG